MTDDLPRIAVLGVAASLLAFEVVVATRSLYDAWSTERDRDPTASRLGRTNHGRLLISQAFAIRGHLAERRRVTNALRRQYAVLGTHGYGRRLRRAIGHAHSGQATVADCPSCRTARLKGQVRCVECGRRLMAPAVSAGA
jgi:hypothetical protein